MENKFEEKLKHGYEEYLKLPKAECSGVNREAELYSKHWCRSQINTCKIL